MRCTCAGGRNTIVLLALIGSAALLPHTASAQDTARISPGPDTTGAALAQDTAAAAKPSAHPVLDKLAARRARPEITDVTIRESGVIPSREIVASIVTTKSTCRSIFLEPFCLISRAPAIYERHYLDRVELKRDVLRIRIVYWRRGYRLASVDTTVTSTGTAKVKVLFLIHQGPPTQVTEASISPDSIFTARQQARWVRPTAGQPLNLVALDSTLIRLERQLWRRGYSDVRIDTAMPLTGQPADNAADRYAAAQGKLGAGTAALKLTIHTAARATVDTVIINGNDHVSDETIRETVAFQPHDIFYQANVDRSQRLLYQTNLFRSAKIRVTPAHGKPDSAKAVTVSVEESPPHVAQAGVGFTTVDFFSLTGRFDNYNWGGGARHLALQASVGNLGAPQLYTAFNNGFKLIPPGTDPGPYLDPTWSVNADFTQPRIFSRYNSAGAGLFYYRRIAPGVFIDNGYGASATFTQELADTAPLSLGYRFAVSRVDASDVYFCVNYGVCDQATREVLLTKTRLSPIILTGQIYRANDPLNATSGYVANAEVQYANAWTASDFHYARAFINASLYRPVAGSVLAFNVRLGAVTPLGGREIIGDTSANILHPTVRFYAGGASSVRGFGENFLGPHVLTIPPEVLRGMQVSKDKHDTTFKCDPTTPIAQCPVNVPYLSDADFSVQPLGGRTLIEGSVEFRFPITKTIGGVVFVDAGIVGASTIAHATSGASAVTPGVGLRYNSVVGPIRVDVGLNPLQTEHLVVETEDLNGKIVVVTGPPGAPGSSQRIYQATTGGLLDRLAFHLSIGQAF